MKETMLDKGIEIPSVNPRSELGRRLFKMEVGDSFLTKMARASVYSLARYYDVSVVIRLQEDGQLRVWRVDNNKPKKRKVEAE